MGGCGPWKGYEALLWVDLEIFWNKWIICLHLFSLVGSIKNRVSNNKLPAIDLKLIFLNIM